MAKVTRFINLSGPGVNHAFNFERPCEILSTRLWSVSIPYETTQEVRGVLLIVANNYSYHDKCRGIVMQGAVRQPYTWRCSITIPAGSVGTYLHDFSLDEDSAPVSRPLFATSVDYTLAFVDISGGTAVLGDFVEVGGNISMCLEIEMLER